MDEGFIKATAVTYVPSSSGDMAERIHVVIITKDGAGEQQLQSSIFLQSGCREATKESRHAELRHRCWAMRADIPAELRMTA